MKQFEKAIEELKSSIKSLVTVPLDRYAALRQCKRDIRYIRKKTNDQFRDISVADYFKDWGDLIKLHDSYNKLKWWFMKRI